MPKCKTVSLTVMLVLGAGIIDASAGTIITDRTTLNTLLGSSSITENFENIIVGSAQYQLGFGQPLNSSTVLPAFSGIPTQGPGLVIGGVNFIPTGSTPSLTINRPGFPSAGNPTDPTQTLGTAGGGGGQPATPLLIDFSVPVNAIGIDLLSPGQPFLGGVNHFTVTIFASNDVTLLETDAIDVPDAFPTGGSRFFGVSESQNIGSLRIQSQTFNTVDNLTIGTTTVPEPATWLLLGGGFAALALARKKMKPSRADRM